MLPAELLAALAPFTGSPQSVQCRPVAGGSINQAWLLAGDGGRFFLKLNAAAAADMFAAEAAGLAELAAARAVRVPRVVAAGVAAERAWLLLEYLELGAASAAAAALLGRQLARQHRVTAASFGWQRDNTIGSTPQPNGRDADWVRFFARQRLGHQLQLAAAAGHGQALQADGRRLLARLPEFFGGYRPPPSLLHGDLWGGNWGVTTAGEPVVFDPAVYFGDREADLAMTRLFGGFPPAFHAAYEREWPLDPGHRQRRDLYNLYHVLNHLNLFGEAYLGQARAMLAGLLAHGPGSAAS